MNLMNCFEWQMNLFGLTRTLIDIPSVTRDEQAVGVFLAEYLDSIGFSASLQEVEHNRFNVIAH